MIGSERSPGAGRSTAFLPSTQASHGHLFPSAIVLRSAETSSVQYGLFLITAKQVTMRQLRHSSRRHPRTFLVEALPAVSSASPTYPDKYQSQESAGTASAGRATPTLI